MVQAIPNQTLAHVQEGVVLQGEDELVAVHGALEPRIGWQSESEVELMAVLQCRQL